MGPDLRQLLCAASIVASAAACAGPNRTATPDAALPPDGFLGQWKRAEAARTFRGAELYGHIDGGAEVFLELGFDHLVVERYAADAGEVVVELYVMDDAVAATGIYLLKCGHEHPDPTLTVAHTVSPDQLLMRRGSVFAAINRAAGDGVDSDTLVSFARYLVEQLPAGEAAGLFDPMDNEGRIPGSERVLRGPFTLQEVYTLGPGDVLSLEQGALAVAAAFEDGSSLILATYRDDATAELAFDHLARNLDPYLEVIDRQSARLMLKDYAGRYAEILRAGNQIIAHLKLDRVPMEGSGPAGLTPTQTSTGQ
jgi:hypothetical protein